jgi:uridine kinase
LIGDNQVHTEAFNLLNRVFAPKQTSILLIDGPAGAGKTTLALEIQAKTDSALLHLDDFYDGWDEPFDANFIQRVKRAINHLIDPISQPSFMKYDWNAESFVSAEMKRSGKLIIVEGVGAGLLSKSLPADNQGVIFVDVESETGVQRVIERDGRHLSTQIQKWKDREESIFASYNARQLADLTL